MLHRRYLILKFPEILMLAHKKIFSVFYSILNETFSNSYGFVLYRNSIFSVLTLYFIIGNIFVLSWLIWANHSFMQQFIKSSSGWSEKMFSQNTFQKCSCSLMFFKIGAFINFPKFTRKYLYWSLLVIMSQVWWPSTLLKKRPHHRCFPVNITKCLTIALWNISGGCFWKWLKSYLWEEFIKEKDL